MLIESYSWALSSTFMKSLQSSLVLVCRRTNTKQQLCQEMRVKCGINMYATAPSSHIVKCLTSSLALMCTQGSITAKVFMRGIAAITRPPSKPSTWLEKTVTGIGRLLACQMSPNVTCCVAYSHSSNSLSFKDRLLTCRLSAFDKPELCMHALKLLDGKQASLIECMHYVLHLSV